MDNLEPSNESFGFLLVSPPPDEFALGDPDWLREKKWIQEVVHRQLVKADDEASEALQLFKKRLEIEIGKHDFDRRRLMFYNYREEILRKHRQLKLRSFFTDHWEKKGGYSEEMLTALADSVRMRYKNMGGFWKAGEVVMELRRVYFSYFLLMQFNDFEKKELINLATDQGSNDSVPAHIKPTFTATTLSLSTYKTFIDLFQVTSEGQELVEILQKVTQKNRKRIIDDTGRWMNKKGGLSILIAWVEVLQERGKFKEKVPELTMAKFLNDYFIGLNFDLTDGSIWRKITKTRNSYHAEFLQLIK